MDLPSKSKRGALGPVGLGRARGDRAQGKHFLRFGLLKSGWRPITNNARSHLLPPRLQTGLSQQINYCSPKGDLYDENNQCDNRANASLGWNYAWPAADRLDQYVNRSRDTISSPR